MAGKEGVPLEASRCLMSALLLLGLACSRTGMLSGRIALDAGGGPTVPPRTTVLLIPAAAGFNRDWQRLLEESRTVLAPARARHQAAAEQAARTRRAWDQAVATPAVSGIGLRPWNQSPAGRACECRLWTDAHGRGRR